MQQVWERRGCGFKPFQQYSGPEHDGANGSRRLKCKEPVVFGKIVAFLPVEHVVKGLRIPENSQQSSIAIGLRCCQGGSVGAPKRTLWSGDSRTLLVRDFRHFGFPA